MAESDEATKRRSDEGAESEIESSAASREQSDAVLAPSPSGIGWSPGRPGEGLANVPLAKKLTLRFGPELRVCPSVDFERDVEALLGQGSVDLVGDGLKRLRRLQQQKLFAAEREPEPAAIETAGISDAIDPEED